MLYGMIGGFVVLCAAIIFQEDKINKLATKFDNLVEKHNGFIDFMCEELDKHCIEANERIDEINNEFNGVYNVLSAAKDTNDDLVDTLELMCDTDEMIIDRLNAIEDDSAYMRDVMEEHDEVLYSFFEETPEQDEEITDNKMIEGCCGKIGEDDEYEYFKKVEVTAKKKQEANKRGRPKKQK